MHSHPHSCSILHYNTMMYNTYTYKCILYNILKRRHSVCNKLWGREHLSASRPPLWHPTDLGEFPLQLQCEPFNCVCIPKKGSLDHGLRLQSRTATCMPRHVNLGYSPSPSISSYQTHLYPTSLPPTQQTN